jgi:hypothetical protein
MACSGTALPLPFTHWQTRMFSWPHDPGRPLCFHVFCCWPYLGYYRELVYYVILFRKGNNGLWVESNTERGAVEDNDGVFMFRSDELFKVDTVIRHLIYCFKFFLNYILDASTIQNCLKEWDTSSLVLFSFTFYVACRSEGPREHGRVLNRMRHISVLCAVLNE